MSIYVTWKYDEDSIHQENDKGDIIELTGAFAVQADEKTGAVKDDETFR